MSVTSNPALKLPKAADLRQAPRTYTHILVGRTARRLPPSLGAHPGSRGQFVELVLHPGDPSQMPIQLLIDVVEVRHDSLQDVVPVERPPEAAQSCRTRFPAIPASSLRPSEPACALRAPWPRRAFVTISYYAIWIGHGNQGIPVPVAVRVPNCTACLRFVSRIMSGFMRPVLADLGPVDMLNIAAYVATLVPPPLPSPSSLQTASR